MTDLEKKAEEYATKRYDTDDDEWIVAHKAFLAGAEYRPTAGGDAGWVSDRECINTMVDVDAPTPTAGMPSEKKESDE